MIYSGSAAFRRLGHIGEFEYRYDRRVGRIQDHEFDNIANDQFDPSQYQDDVRQRIWAVIQQKVEGGEITEIEEEAPKAQIIDLMEALKASLGDPAADAAAQERKPARRSARAKKTTGRRRKASAR